MATPFDKAGYRGVITDPSDFLTIAELTDQEPWIWGINPSHPSASDNWEMVSHLGTFDWRTIADAGVQLSIRSSSGSDTLAGTGVRTVQIIYIDGNGVRQAETVTMSGVTLVNTVATNIRRVLKLKALTAGSGGVASGNITLEALGGGTVYEQIPSEETCSKSCLFHIPAGKKGFIKGWSCGASASEVELALCADYDQAAKTRITSTTVKTHVLAMHRTVVSNMHRFELPLSRSFPTGTDIYVAAHNATGGTTVKESAQIELILVDA